MVLLGYQEPLLMPGATHHRDQIATIVTRANSTNIICHRLLDAFDFSGAPGNHGEVILAELTEDADRRDANR